MNFSKWILVFIVFCCLWQIYGMVESMDDTYIHYELESIADELESIDSRLINIEDDVRYIKVWGAGK
jgi:hypothetical protein